MNVLFWLSIGLDRRTPSEHLLTAMIEALYKRGHTVHILQKDTGGHIKELYPKLRDLGVTTTKIEMSPVEHGNLVNRYVSDIGYVQKAKSWLKVNGHMFDRVFLQSSNVAGFQVRVLKSCMPQVPIIFNIQDIFPENAVYSGKLKKNGVPYYFFSCLQKYAYKNANALITISEDMKSEIVQLGVNADKIEVIYNWSYQDEPYDISLSEDRDIRKMLPHDTFNVVYAGNIGVMQNVEVLIDTARQSTDPNIVYHIFGDGIYKQKLIERAKNLNNVKFWPMQLTEKAPALYSCADVNVIPLAHDIYRTALPSKTATCMAVRKPIAFCIGKTSAFGREVMRKTGYECFDCNDTRGLLGYIEKIKKGLFKFNTDAFFVEYMSVTKNSMRYAEIIENAQ